MLVKEGICGAFRREGSIGGIFAQLKEWNAWMKVSDTFICHVNKSQGLDSFIG